MKSPPKLTANWRTASMAAGLLAGLGLSGCGAGDSDQFVMSGSFASSDGVGSIIYGESDSNSGQQVLLEGDRFSVPLDKGKTYHFLLNGSSATVIGRLMFCDDMENTLAIPNSASGAFDFGQFLGFTPVRKTNLGGNWAPQNRPDWLTCTLTPSTKWLIRDFRG